MKRIAIPLGIVIALLCMTESASAKKHRYTVIHITKNYRKNAQEPGDCRATVTTDTLPSQNGDPVTWVVLNGNGHDTDDVCALTNKSLLWLIFDSEVMSGVYEIQAKDPNGDNHWVVEGTIDPGIDKGMYRYWIYFNGVPAADPEIEVNCPDCGGKE